MSAMLFSLIIAGAYAFNATPLYTATAEVIVVTESGETASELVQSNDFSQSQVRSYSAVAVRPIVLDQVIQNLGLDTTPAELATQVSVTSPLNTVLISVSAKDPSPEAAAAIANEVSKQLAAVVAELAPTTPSGEQKVRLESIQVALPPASPSSPNVKFDLALGIIGGLALGVAAVALLESLNTKVRSAAEASEIVSAPLLGTIAFENGVGRHPLVGGAHDQSNRAESFRQLCTSIQFLDAVNPSPLLAVTSAVPAEGKSLTSINLAISLAAAGERVCLVDCDLRRPQVGRYLGMEGEVGLTTVLLGTISLADAVQPWGRSGLDVLVSGQRPPNPSELLGSPPMSQLLAKLAATYTLVVLDCAPLVPVTDTALVARECGGAVLVVGAGVVHRSDLTTAKEILASIGVPILGTVVNRVKGPDASRHKYTYEGSTSGAPLKPGMVELDAAPTSFTRS